MTTDKNKLDKLIINCPPLGNVGAPMGNQNATKHKDEGVKIDKDKIKKSPTGNSREYWIGRLKRDAPAHLTLLQRGKYKSVTEAARKAGLRGKPPFNPEQILKKIEKLDFFELDSLLYLVETRIKSLENKCTAHGIAKALHCRLSQKNKNILYVLLYDSKSAYHYMSQGTKLINYTKKFFDKWEYVTIKNDIGNYEKYNIAHANILQFKLYIAGKIEEIDYVNFVNKNNLPRIHRAIMPYNYKKYSGELLNPRTIKLYDFNEEESHTNSDSLYFNTIQDFLDK